MVLRHVCAFKSFPQQLIHLKGSVPLPWARPYVSSKKRSTLFEPMRPRTDSQNSTRRLQCRVTCWFQSKWVVTMTIITKNTIYEFVNTCSTTLILIPNYIIIYIYVKIILWTKHVFTLLSQNQHLSKTGGDARAQSLEAERKNPYEKGQRGYK